MKTIVQKYGGSSLATPQHLAAVAERIAKARRGRKLAVVVSAMGDVTDELLALARDIHPDAAGGALDALLAAGEQISAAGLCLALEKIGVKARFHSGLQLPIRTDGVYNDARIEGIDATRIRKDFQERRVAVVTGYQGVDENGDINTLGRGGSDASAVALAVALNADECQIYTDVDGVCTADPRIVDKSRTLKNVEFDEMLELAGQGAQVLQTRSVELAEAFSMPLRVLHSAGDGPGTLISCREASPTPARSAELTSKTTLTRIEYQSDEAELSLFGVKDTPGSAARVLATLGAAGLNVDVIVQSATQDSRANLSFTVARRDWKRARAAIEDCAAALGARLSDADEADIAKLSVVMIRRGGRSRAMVAGQMFKALADANVNIRTISASETKIAVIVAKRSAARARQALQRAFANGAKAPTRELRANAAAPRRAAITGIAYRRDEAKLTITDVPNRPGVAARALEILSREGLEIDVIAQNVAANGDTRLAFTVAREDLKRARGAARRAAKAIGAARVQVADNVAKVSVVGRGMRHKPGVASRMFETLARNNVNLDMICTSEIKIAVIIKQDFLELAVRALHAAFGLGDEAAPDRSGRPESLN